MNIMLIDDDEAIRDMLQDIIEDYELGTVVASLPSAATLTTTELIARHIDHRYAHARLRRHRLRAPLP